MRRVHLTISGSTRGWQPEDPKEVWRLIGLPEGLVGGLMMAGGVALLAVAILFVEDFSWRVSFIVEGAILLFMGLVMASSRILNVRNKRTGSFAEVLLFDRKSSSCLAAVLGVMRIKMPNAFE